MFLWFSSCYELNYALKLKFGSIFSKFCNQPESWKIIKNYWKSSRVTGTHRFHKNGHFSKYTKKNCQKVSNTIKNCRNSSKIVLWFYTDSIRCFYIVFWYLLKNDHFLQNNGFGQISMTIEDFWQVSVHFKNFQVSCEILRK